MKKKKKILKASSKQKIYPKKKKENKKIMFLVGLVESHMILQSYMILHDPTYNPTIFTILVRF